VSQTACRPVAKNCSRCWRAEDLRIVPIAVFTLTEVLKIQGDPSYSAIPQKSISVSLPCSAVRFAEFH
jgi:hypothetical protein